MIIFVIVFPSKNGKYSNRDQLCGAVHLKQFKICLLHILQIPCWTKMTNMSCAVYRGCKSGHAAKTFAAIFVRQPAEKIIQT